MTSSILLFSRNSNAMIIRHDINDQKYQELGEKYSTSVAYLGGCAGTLIDRSWILTAAHCVIGRENEILSVRHKDIEYRVEKILLHPDFDQEKTIQHDIALVQLKEPIDVGEPATLYTLRDEQGQTVVFVGRGTFGNGRKGLIKEDGKQRGATNVVTSASEQTLEFCFDSPENATPTEGISGRGDSGGPAFVTLDSQLYVAGVSSYQDGNGFEEGNYGVLEYYTRVSTNARWIESVLQNAQPSTMPGHPVIDAIKQGSEQQLREAIGSDIIEDVAIINEAFIQTILMDRVDLAQVLFESGVSIESITINGASLFELSLRNGRVEYFDDLMARPSQEDAIHKKDSVILPLLVASRRDDPQLIDHVKILLEQGANINVQTSQGETAILLAGWLTSNVELIRNLIDHGADVNIPNNNGDTPLIDAAYLGKNDILELLLDNGADRDIKNNNERSAMDMAKQTENKYAMKLLGSYGAD